MTSWRTVVLTWYSTNWPRRSLTMRPADWSTARCRQIVGQRLSNAAAISPDVRRFARSIRRISRRVGSARARNARLVGIARITISRLAN